MTVDFTGFTGSGFSPNPTAGQLCSNAWVVTGLSDGDGTVGGTHTSGDFARDNTTGGENTGGVYSLDNGAMWFQPGSSDLTPGRVYLRVKNETGSAITSVDVAYDLLYRNDQGRANSFNFAWAIDNDDTSIPVSFTGVAALDFTSPEAANVLGNQTENKSTTLSGLNWPAGDVLYLCWELDDVSGGGSRDEFGLDNVSVTLPAPSCAPPSITTTCMPVTIDFTGFGGEGFDTDPAANQLCSNAWVVLGLSDGDGQIGGTHTSGDFARSNTPGGGVNTGGVYALDNGAIWFQPVGSDLTPGDLILRVKNETGSTINSVRIAYDILYRNDQSRANSFNFAYALEIDIPGTFEPVPSLDFTSPEAADANGNQTASRSIVLENLNWTANDVLQLYWRMDDVSGGGSRDEFGLDNIVVSADATAPSLTCPAPVTVNTANGSCTVSNIDLGGMPSVTEDCNYNLDNDAQAMYSIGSHTVTWTATDDSGNTGTCSQSVTVDPYVSPPGEYFDLNTCQSTLCPPGFFCTGGKTEAEPCPAGTFQSSPGQANCEPCDAGTSNNLTAQTECTPCDPGFYSANGATMCFECTPSLSCPTIPPVNASNNSCAAEVMLTQPTPTNNCPTETLTNNAGSNTFPVGNTVVTWTLTDVSGATATCSYTVTVNDAQAPTVTCPPNLSVAPTNTNPCSAVVNDIDASNVTDNCPGVVLSYTRTGATVDNGGGSASGETFNEGNTIVTYTVTDATGNIKTCSFSITVNACATEAISGTILWENDDDDGVKNATVTVTGDGSGNDNTDTNGDYSVVIGTIDGDYTITPVKENNKLDNGVEAADATRIQQHVANISLITDPYKQIAADVNKDNSISILDPVLITQALLGNPNAIALFTNAWRFVPTSPALSLPPWGYAENIVLTGVTGDQLNQNFTGIKVGDVVATFADPQLRPEPVRLVTEDKYLEADQTIVVPIRVEGYNDIAAIQFAMKIDPVILEFDGLRTPEGALLTEDNFGLYNIKHNEVRCVLAKPTGSSVADGSEFFIMRFNVKQSGAMLSEALQLDATQLQPKAFDAVLTPRPVVLQFPLSTSTSNQQTTAISLTARPNPAKGAANLHFSLPQAGEAVILIRDAQGRLISQQRAYYDAGNYVQRIELSQPGLYLAELRTERGAKTVRIIATR